MSRPTDHLVIRHEKGLPVSGHIVTYEANGVRHREDGPAFLEYRSSGSLVRETYYRNGERHRVDGPADLEYFEDGSVQTEEWLVEGRPHRLDGPAFRERDESGFPVEELWFLDGREHRVGGPASILTSVGVREEEWYRRGRRSRIDGPTHVTGSPVRRFAFSFTGVGYDSHVELLDDLGRYPEDVVREHIVGSVYEPLLADYDTPTIISALGTGVLTLDAVRAVLDGAPAEWAHAYEGGVAT